MAIFKLAAKLQTNVVCAVAMIALALTARELWVVNPFMTAVACAKATTPASTALAPHMVSRFQMSAASAAATTTLVTATAVMVGCILCQVFRRSLIVTSYAVPSASSAATTRASRQLAATACAQRRPNPSTCAAFAAARMLQTQARATALVYPMVFPASAAMGNAEPLLWSWIFVAFAAVPTSRRRATATVRGCHTVLRFETARACAAT
mmetsp:Transcript_5308/g.8548  ORF Transcript_5308/g.8548 Transcript_5308/m.8548 type:complete len:209 (-) Transcript_5308:491-1117(-)